MNQKRSSQGFGRNQNQNQNRRNFQKLRDFRHTFVYRWLKGLFIVLGIIYAINFITGNFGYEFYLPSYNRNRYAYDYVENARSDSIFSVKSLAPMRDTSGASIELDEVESPNFPAESATSTNSTKYKIYNAYVSTVVKDIHEYKNSLTEYVQKSGGYVVSEKIDVTTSTLPQYNQTDHAYNMTLVVRVPAEKLQDFLDYVQKNAQDVVSMDVNGSDVTDQYEDLGRKLKLYEKTYARLQEIYNKATDTKDLLAIQSRMLSVQRDIDRIKGRMAAIEKQAKFSRVTIHATTDKYSLNYMPKNIWDLDVTLKLAVRGLMTVLANIAKAIIWLVVFSPLLAVLYFGYKWVKSRV